MKFAHTFNRTLSSENFPEEWQAAAIQYRQLKKCIKRVQLELLELGLTVETLRTLATENKETCEKERGYAVKYMFDGDIQNFRPKLVLTINGSILNMRMRNNDVRVVLQAILQRRGEGCHENDGWVEVGPTDDEDESSQYAGEHQIPLTPSPLSHMSTLEIPLSNDSVFFHSLMSELASLDVVHSRASQVIQANIISIGDMVMTVTAPMRSRSDLYPWRGIFSTYLETEVFFSTRETEVHKERTVEDARDRFQKFSNEVERIGLHKRFRNRQSQELYTRFLGVNEELLLILRFQAINKIAMQKILKKFDKRTALGALQKFPTLVASNPFVASDLAKTVCFAMSSKIVSVIPQLDDYLCPICQSINVKPVRLLCSHVFCVRCLVKLQRGAQLRCPICRREVVMQANSTNVDIGMLNLLNDYFPKEAKKKQKENEREVVLEQWYNVHKKQPVRETCVIM